MLLLATCRQGRHATDNNNIHTNNDTIVLFKKDSSFIAGNITTVTKCSFLNNSGKALKNPVNTLLILDQPTLLPAPEGVYELYLSSQPPDIDKLSSSRAGFTALLDMYSFTAPGAKPQIEMDISEAIKRLLLQNPSLPAVYIIIRFQPVKLSDGTYSNKAGELRFKGLSIVHVKM